MADEMERDALADTVRDLIRATRTTMVGPDDRQRAIDLLAEAHRILDATTYPGPHCQVGWSSALTPGEGGPGPQSDSPSHFEANPLPYQFFPFSPVVGPQNPIAPPLDIRRVDDGMVEAVVTLTEQYNGPPWDIVHGGVVALLFDELLGVATILDGVAGFTGRLTVHYRKPTPILQPIRLRAWVDHVSGRKVTAKGEIRVVETDLVTAEAEGLFIQTGGPISEANRVAEEPAPS